MISVVIPVFNGAHILPTTVPAVLPLVGVAEIVWVDDGSTDATSALLREATASDDRAHVVTLPENAGRSAARNAGIATSTGDTLVFFDADVEPPPEAAHQLAEAAQLTGAVAAVARLQPVVTDPDEPYQDYVAHARRGPAPGLSADAPADWRYFLAGACAVRRSALDAVGGFPTDVPYGEDQALACRLAAADPAGLRVAGTTVALHDLGDLGRAVANAEAYGRTVAGLPETCRSMAPRAFRWRRALGSVAGLARPALESVIASLPSGTGRRALVRYLLASAALYAAAHPSPPAARRGRRDGV